MDSHGLADDTSTHPAQLVDARELAALLRVSSRCVRRWLKAGLFLHTNVVAFSYSTPLSGDRA